MERATGAGEGGRQRDTAMGRATGAGEGFGGGEEDGAGSLLHRVEELRVVMVFAYAILSKRCHVFICVPEPEEVLGISSFSM